MGKGDKSAEVTLAPEAVALVHAFIHVHASKKLAEKFASHFPKLSLDNNLPGAEELANALVTTVKTAVAGPDSAVAKVLGNGDKEDKEDKEDKGDKEEKKGKKDKKDKKRKRESKDKEETAAQNETATESGNDPTSESGEPAEKQEEPEVPEGKGEEEQEKPAENAEDTSMNVDSASEPPAKSKKRKDSGIANRFQRVKSDQTVYLDDRLKDMSYAAKARLC